jgi:dTDP-4-amino-4,6-dideoxy-D-galactose acyltransferase
MLPIEQEVATPVSHHFENRELGSKLVEFSDALELRDRGPSPPPDAGPFIYHSEVDATSDLSDEKISQFIDVKDRYEPELVSLHLATRYQEAIIEDGRYVGVGNPYDRDTLSRRVQQTVEATREIFNDIPILLENNNHLGTDAYDVVTDPSFIEDVVTVANAEFLFDIAHAKISARTTHTDIDEYISKLPLDKCRQVHLSRPDLRSDEALDVHAFLRQDDWSDFDRYQHKLPNLRYVTLEYYDNVTVLLDQIERMQTGSGEQVISTEPWDTDFFGVQIASIVCDTTTPECLDYAIVRCRETDIACLYFKTADNKERDFALNRGFSLVDTKLVFECVVNDQSSVDTDTTVRSCIDSDINHLSEIAGSIFADTRFYNDPRFPDSACDELYATWIRNACNGFADEVLVALLRDTPVGFITCNLDGRSGDIGLIGIAEEFQGTGIGSDLVAAAVEWFDGEGADRITVETQSTNTAAAELYKSAGFSLVEERYVLHRWFDE